jgi:ketosteroid isomerase-like protein
VALDPVELVRRYHAALNRYDPKVMPLMFAETATYQSPGVGGLLIGRAAIIEAFNAYFAQYPDQVAEDEEIVAIGTHSARSDWRLRATSRATGKVYVRQGRETVTFSDDGRILRVEVEDR